MIEIENLRKIRNLAIKEILDTSITGGSAIWDQEKWNCEIKDSVGLLDFISIDTTKILKNKKFLLSFKIKKTKGNIATIGGELFGKTDEELDLQVYLDKKLIGTAWSGGVGMIYPEDELEHRVDVFMSVKDMYLTEKRMIKIIPNQESEVSYSATIKDIQFVETDLFENWVPPVPSKDVLIFNELSFYNPLNNLDSTDNFLEDTILKVEFFNKNAEKFGIVPKFLNLNMYLECVILKNGESNVLEIAYVARENRTILFKKELPSLSYKKVKLESRQNGTYYAFYLNDEYLYGIEYRMVVEGFCGVIGTSEVSINSYEIKTLQPNEWEPILDDDSIVMKREDFGYNITRKKEQNENLHPVGKGDSISGYTKWGTSEYNVIQEKLLDESKSFIQVIHPTVGSPSNTNFGICYTRTTNPIDVFSVTKGNIYTLSFIAAVQNGLEMKYLFLMNRGGFSNQILDGTNNGVISTSKKYLGKSDAESCNDYYYYQITFMAFVTDNRAYLLLGNRNEVVTTEENKSMFKIADIKLELGETATEYSPSRLEKYLNADYSPKSYLKKQLTLKPSTNYTLSLRGKGIGYYSIGTKYGTISESNPITFSSNLGSELKLSTISSDEFLFKEVQIEEGNYSNEYVNNETIPILRDASEVSIPMQKNIERQSGTIILEVNSSTVVNNCKIFELGDFQLIYENQEFKWISVKSIGKALHVPYQEFKGNVKIVLTWINNTYKLIILGAQTVSNESLNGEIVGDFGIINFSKAPLFMGTIKKLTIFNQDVMYRQVNAEEIDIMIEEGKAIMFAVDFKENMEYKKKPYLESTLAPMDGSPILVNDTKGPMRRQFFFDFETGKYRSYNEEIFDYRGESVIPICFDGLDENFRVTVRLGNELIGEPVTFKGNLIYLTLSEEEKGALYGYELTIRYQLDRSYNIEFNETAALDSYQVNFANHSGEEITITQEGNRTSNTRLAKEIELNPIVNPQNTGFMYIVKNNQEANGFRLNLSSDMMHANGIDSADFVVEVIDSEKNEILSPYVDVYLIDEYGKTGTGLGVLTPIVSYDTLKARNAAGRLYYKYTSPYIKESIGRKTKRIFAVAFDRKQKIGVQIPIVLRPTQTKLYSGVKLPAPGSSLAFEYLSRYFERKNIPTEVLEVLDKDGNGQLTREDLDQFIVDQYKTGEMKEIENLLLRLEE